MKPHLLAANELDILSEIVGGIPPKEAQPLNKINKPWIAIHANITSPTAEACACVHETNAYNCCRNSPTFPSFASNLECGCALTV